MAQVVDHLSVDDLERGVRSARDLTAARHFQVIWLVARGRTMADVAAVTSFVRRWIEPLLARYNVHGPDARGDLRRANGTRASLLRPELLARLRERLETPSSDGGLWTGAGRERIILLVLDNAGWHTEPGLAVPDGIRLVSLPRYSPELQPAERLWPVLDEPLANHSFGTLAELEQVVTERCRILTSDQLKPGTNFHWWPKPAIPA